MLKIAERNKIMSNRFSNAAAKETCFSPLVEGKIKVDTDDIIKKYPNGVTIIGFILCFPVPVTYLIWKSEKLIDKVKYILIGAIWAVYVGIFILPFIAPFFMFWF